MTIENSDFALYKIWLLGKNGKKKTSYVVLPEQKIPSFVEVAQTIDKIFPDLLITGIKDLGLIDIQKDDTK